MDSEEKILQLRAILKETVTPLIDRDYVYLDLPYYFNIGDTLIWEGTRSFLKTIPYKCLYTTNYSNYNDSKVDKSSIILFQGGGNFGDLYPELNNFRKEVILKHPDQKVIILPQTVTYQDKKNLLKDAEFYKDYPNVTICARDKVSYGILKEYFVNNKILLLPDMAFFIDIDERFRKRIIPGKTLYLKRTDKEFVDLYKDIIPNNAEIHDWPTFEPNIYIRLCYSVCRRISGFLRKIDAIAQTSLAAKYDDYVWQNILRIFNVRLGYNFLAPYEIIYTTRLHVLILSILLRKSHINILDNKYGKLSSFYQTWLSDLSSIRYLKK